MKQRLKIFNFTQGSIMFKDAQGVGTQIKVIGYINHN